MDVSTMPVVNWVNGSRRARSRCPPNISALKSSVSPASISERRSQSEYINAPRIGRSRGWGVKPAAKWLSRASNDVEKQTNREIGDKSTMVYSLSEHCVMRVFSVMWIDSSLLLSLTGGHAASGYRPSVNMYFSAQRCCSEAASSSLSRGLPGSHRAPQWQRQARQQEWRYCPIPRRARRFHQGGQHQSFSEAVHKEGRVRRVLRHCMSMTLCIWRLNVSGMSNEHKSFPVISLLRRPWRNETQSRETRHNQFLLEIVMKIYIIISSHVYVSRVVRVPVTCRMIDSTRIWILIHARKAAGGGRIAASSRECDRSSEGGTGIKKGKFNRIVTPVLRSTIRRYTMYDDSTICDRCSFPSFSHQGIVFVFELSKALRRVYLWYIFPRENVFHSKQRIDRYTSRRFLCSSGRAAQRQHRPIPALTSSSLHKHFPAARWPHRGFYWSSWEECKASWRSAIRWQYRFRRTVHLYFALEDENPNIYQTSLNALLSIEASWPI